jgi:hypothetical protein
MSKEKRLAIDEAEAVSIKVQAVERAFSPGPHFNGRRDVSASMYRPIVYCVEVIDSQVHVLAGRRERATILGGPIHERKNDATTMEIEPARDSVVRIHPKDLFIEGPPF